MRYLACETRLSEPCTHSILPFGTTEKVDGCADAVFVDGTNKCIEYVMYSYAKPSVTQKGNKPDASVYTYLPLYILFCMAEDKAKELGVSSDWTIGSSIYYLKKKNDKLATPAACDPNFFNRKGGLNIVSLTSTLSDAHAIHDIYTPQIDAFLDKSSTMDDAVCECCEMRPICKWQSAPIPVAKTQPAHGVSVHSLTPDQQQVVFFNNGIARVNAGAGAGKTTAIVLNVIKMIEDGVDPYTILMLTFTNAAAKEMKERINVYGETYDVGETDAVTVTTFHGFGNSLLQQEYAKYGYSTPPVLIDDVERAAILDELMMTHTVPGVDYRNYTMNMPNCRGALAVCTHLLHIIKKFAPTTVAEARKHLEDSPFYTDASIAYVIDTLLPAYNKVLLERNLMEYEDQEACVHLLLQQNPKYLERLGIEHIIVDEFQDTDEGEFELLKAFVHSDCFQSLMVVGDDSQAIYGFRETSPEFMLDFWNKLEVPANVKTSDFVLAANHRSSKNIVKLANKINDICGTKQLVTSAEAGVPVSATAFRTNIDEVAAITADIAARIRDGENAEDFCIIAYKKTELQKYATALENEGVPYQMINPELLIENSNVQAALALPDFGTSSLAQQIVYTALSHGIEAENTLEWRREMHNTVTAALENGKEHIIALLRVFDADQTDELYQNFVGMLDEKEDILEYLRAFKMYGDTQAAKRTWRYGGVTLTTAHSSKGLEWPIVYASLSGFDGKDIVDKLAEERMRLLYVTITRARKELNISGVRYAFGSVKNGDKTLNRYLETVFNALGMDIGTDDEE